MEPTYTMDDLTLKEKMEKFEGLGTERKTKVVMEDDNEEVKV